MLNVKPIHFHKMARRRSIEGKGNHDSSTMIAYDDDTNQLDATTLSQAPFFAWTDKFIKNVPIENGECVSHYMVDQ